MGFIKRILSGKTYSDMISAAKNGELNELRGMIDLGMDVNAAMDDDNMPPLALATINGWTDIVQLLVESGADVHAMCGYNKDKTPIHYAAEFDRSEIVPILIANGADPDALTADSVRVAALHIAAGDGHKDTVRALLVNGASIDVMNSSGTKPICLAAFEGHIATVEVLLEYGANTEIKSVFRRKISEDIPMVELLLNKGNVAIHG